MAKFNVEAALNSGYSEAEIADYLGQESKFNVEGAREAGYSEREILAELTKPTPGLVETAYRGLRRSVGELGVLGGDILPALAASALLQEEKAKPFVERQIREAATTRAELEARFPTVYESYKDVEGIGSGFGYVAERFGELLPDIIPSIFSGGVGYAAGKKIAKEAAEEAAQKMFAKKEREMIESGIAGDMTSLEIKNIAAPFSRKAAEELTEKYARTGLGVGTFLGSYAQNAPEVFENIYQETGDIAPAGALLFGGLSAMLDSYLPMKILDDLGGYGKAQLMSKMLKDSGANPAVWKSVLKEGSKAAVGEGLTESAQEAISVAAEKFYGSNKDFFSPENVDRYLESFFAGAAGGGVLGGIGGVGRGLQEKAAKRDIDALFQPPAPPPEDKTTVTTPITPAGGPATGAAAVVSPLEGFDIGKVEPEKVQAAQQFLQDLSGGKLVDELGQPLSKLDANKKLQGVVRSLGIPLKKGTSRKTADLVDLLNTALSAKGVSDATRTEQAAAGVGAGVPVKPGAEVTPEGAPTPPSGGVDVPDRGVAGPEAGAVPSVNTLDDKKKALQEKLAAAKKAKAETKKGLAIGDQGVFTKPEPGPEGTQLVALQEEIRGVRERYLAALQRVDDATNPKEKEVSQEAAAKLEEQLSGLYDQYGALTDKLTKPKTPVQEATGAFTYMPGAVTTEQPGAPTRAKAEVDPEIAALEAELRQVEAETEQIRFDRKLQEDYETVREDFGKVREEDLEGLTEPEKAAARKGRAALPEWGELSTDERMVFEDGLEYYESIPEALQELVSYRQAKGGAKGTKNTTAANYVINRAAESRARGIEFPRWNALSEEERKTFTDTVKAEENRLNTEEGLETLPESDRRYKGPDYRAQQAGFNSLGNILAAKQRSATEAQAAVETENRRLAEARGLTAAQRKEADELSLNQPLPENIVAAVKAGDLQTVLDYLSKEAKGVPTGFVQRALGEISAVLDKTSSEINRLVAGSLSAVLSGDKINLPTVKLVYDESLTTPARYEPKTNTIRVGPRGLNETAVLHEATHAATVRVIFAFLDPKTRNQLSKEQQEAVAHLLRLMQRTRPALEGKYKRAYKDIYEFVAYAMTDPKFQADLKNIELKPEERLTKYSNLLQQEFPEAGVFGPGMGNDTAYESFARAVANALGLVTKFARYVKNLFSYNPYFETTKQTKEDIDEQVADLTEELTDKERKRQEDRIEKEIVQELKNSNEAAEAQAALNKARQAYKRVANKFKDQTKEELNNNAEYLSASENYTKAQAAVDAIKNRTPDLSNLGVTATREQGYLGNVMVEIAGAFDQIISAPPDGGITNWDNKPLFISAGAPTGMKAQEIEERLHKRLEQTNSSVLSRVGSAIASIFTKKGYDNLVRKVQDKTVAFKRMRNLLRMRGQLRVIGGINEYNDIDTAYNSGTALAQNYMNEFIPLTNQATDLMQSLMKSMKLDYTQLLAKLHTYMIGLQEPERRHVLFLRPNSERGVPLTDDADTARIKIWERIRETMPKDVFAAEQANDQVRLDQLKQEAEKLRKDLEDIVYDRNIISGTTNRKYPNDPNFNDEFGSRYNALGYDYSEVQYFKQEYDKAKQRQPEIDRLFKVLQQVMDQTQQFNKETNYFNSGAQSVIWFYGWKSYFPFKGKPDPSGRLQQIESVIDPNSDRIGGDFAQGENTFMGRQSDSDNPVLQIFTEATRSTLRKGYFMAPHAMKNLINTKRVAGEKLSSISFKERANPYFKIKDKVPQNSFLVYQPDGSIDVYAINDPNMLRAFKGTFTPDQPLIDAANKLTSAVGQFHTRYNPAFAPLDFTRNLMTYAGIVGFKYGPAAALQMVTAISRIVSEGGMHKTFMYTKAYGEGNKAKLKQLLGKDPDNFYKDIDTYYKLGGPVAYVQGLTSAQSQTELAKKLGRREVAGMTADDVTNFFDSWIGMFETTSRIAAFRVVKEQLRAQGITNEDELNQRAMAEAKDLANFQKVGEIGKALGAAFMFWRPAATGAVTAIDAMLPAFDTRTEEQLFKYYKEEAGGGATTDEEARAAVKQHMLERRNARYMGYALIGAGMFTYLMAYMLAGDDEEERNKVATDDTARWVRFARFNTGLEVNGRDLVLQMPWGFGPGALASAGAQIMATAMGNQSFLSMANNIMDAGFESFVPLPISKIDKFANPSAAAVDSLTPSVLRPFLQYAMNTDGLGRRIYSDRQSRYGDAFLGSDNVPSLFTDIARGIFDLTGGAVDWSPSTLYFFANNYVDGASRAVATTYNVSQIMVGNKDFDPRTDTFFLDSYLKAPSNYDAIQFSKVENKIKEIEKTLNSIKGTPAYADYLANNPMDQRIVDFYNKTVNGRLRELRAQANKIRRSPDLTTQERQDSLQLLIKQQNQIKSAFTTAMAGVSEDFASFGYED